MTTITAKMVNELRTRSGAPLMDCKRALVESGGDLEQAFDLLRKSGMKTAEKKAGADTGEGRVRLKTSPDGTCGAMVMLACQTDFSANTDGFGALADQLCAHVAKHRPDTPDSLLSQKFDGASETIDETIKGLAGKIGENIRVARIAVLDNGEGRVGGYLHHDQKQGALISLTTSADAAKVDAYLRQLGMHIVSMRPLAARGDEVPADVLERERSVYLDSDEVKAKPEEHRAKIVEGKLKKFLAGVALTEQPWVLDPKQTVQQALEATLGKDARIEAFELFAIGG